MSENVELSIVTEVGTFGSLNIEDPTIKQIKKKKKNDGTYKDGVLDMEALSEATLQLNSNLKNEHF